MALARELFFDARMIAHSGIGTQVRNVLSRLIARKDYRITVLGNASKVRESLALSDLSVVDWDAPIYSIREQLQYPAIPTGAILHFPHYNAPLRFMPQSAVVLHDLIHLQSDEFNKVQRLYCRFFLRRLAASAGTVVTVSDATRDEFLKIHPQAADRTRTVLNGLDHRVFRPSSQTAVASLRKRYGLPKKFLLSVGIGKRHKNVAFVIRALAPFWNRGEFAMPLVLAGTGGVLPEHVHAEILRARCGGHIIVLPRVSESDLPALYSAAEIFLMPSLLEGFGFPLLEAMGCGTATLSSTAASLPEVGGDAPVYFNPRSESDFADKIFFLAGSDVARKKSASRGIRRAKTFSWDRHVDQLAALYEAIPARR